MQDTLRHRGPDGDGIFVSPDGRVGLANRRLAIVDIDGGTQPMFGDDGICLVFNGEIYNYPALRKELEAQGTRFRTNCDTEVILHLYAHHGDACVERLTGMFAFAVWDPRRNRLFFARDPIGEKPFYWADQGGVFVFGSEIKALLEHPLVPRDMNERALGPYLAHLTTPAPETLYRGIYKLPAGCFGSCDARGVSVSPYWDLAHPRQWTPASPDEAAGRVRQLLDESVQARLMSDVPVGVLLSGGLDSSTIAALLREHGQSLDSFAIGFDHEADFDERAEARWVARQYGMNHHEVALSEADVLNLLPLLHHHQDEPLADPVALPLFALYRLAHENGVKVVLSGEGADEMFWGYPGYRRILARLRFFRAFLALPRPVRALAARTTSPSRARRREQLEGLAAGRVRPVHMPLGLTTQQRRDLLRSGDGSTGWQPSERSDVEDVATTLGFDTQEYEFQIRLPELLLARTDRISMANSVEARVPFLDPTLVDYVYRLPVDVKIRRGETKFILKRAIADVVPDRVVSRPKQGFAAPTSAWFAARHGPLLHELSRGTALQRYFDVERVQARLDASAATSWEFGHVLWPILNFALWHKYWIEDEPLDGLVEHTASVTPVAAR